MKTLREFLKAATLQKEEVDRFLDPRQPNWARFDQELGYVIRDGIFRDGVDNSWTIGKYAKSGERISINGYGQPCRINTYGNSFTQCHQVSDGETWQEYLSAHLGEPVRNFGVGGYGVYQAYRRMLRVEAGECSAPYIILNIWGIDDHFRSLDAWRWLRCFEWFRTPENDYMFHANPWVHVRLAPDTGDLIEFPNLCPTEASLYHLCDLDYVYDVFHQDPSLLLHLGQKPDMEVDLSSLKPLAETLGVDWDLSSIERRIRSCAELHLRCALKASEHIVKRTQYFAMRSGKKLMVLLSYFFTNIIDEIEGRPRPDTSFVEFLQTEGILFVDTLLKHVRDYKAFNLSPKEYVDRYFIGHYNPKGNHFFTFAIKDEVVDWLDPKPMTYHAEGRKIGFERYLPSQ